MYIIVKGNNSKGSSKGSSQYQGFTPHWNSAIDKNPIWIGTRQQYDRELKSRGLQVSDPDKEYKPKRSDYKVTNKTRSVVKAISQQTDAKGNFNPSGSLKKELIKRKVIMKKSELEKIKSKLPENSKSGGFYNYETDK